MSVNPNIPMGVAPPQGISNDQQMAPPQVGAGAPPGGPPMGPPGMPPQGAPVTPAQMPQQPQQPADKPPTLLPTNLAMEFAKALNGAKLDAANTLAERIGPPRGTVNAQTTDVLKLWRKRDPTVDPLYEKLVNKKSDDDILQAMYPMRSALIKYGNRTYTDQVEFAEKMANIDADPKYADLNKEIDDDTYEPPTSKYPSRGYEDHTQGQLEQTDSMENPDMTGE